MPKQTRSIRFAPDAFSVRLARASKAGFNFAKIGLWLGVFSAVLAIFAPHLAAQTQIGRFQDEFLNTSKIAQRRNVTIDTVQGLITLKTIADSLEESQNFRLFLSGIDKTFKEPANVSILEDVDLVPGQDDVYLFTDSFQRRVFTFNALSGNEVISSFVNGSLISPVSAHPFLENGTLKVLITEKEGIAPTSPNGRIWKINSSNLKAEWVFPDSARISPDSLRVPSDAVMLQNRSEILICDAGNNRLIAVAMNATGPGAIVWRFKGDFNNPVDVDVDSSDLSGSVYLVTDQFNHRIELVQRVGASGTSRTIFGVKGVSGNSRTLLNRPTDADFLNNGNILISDAGNNRLIEVTRQGAFVRQFAHPLFNLNDVDRIERGIHQGKMVVASKTTQATSVVTAKRLAYASEVFVSPPRDFGRLVDFDMITWSDSLPPGTNIRLQLRTVDDLSDTTNAQWLGPTGPSDFYTTKPSTINPEHDGDRFYQFRAELITQSRLETPLLRAVKVKAHYFVADSDGVVISREIRDAANVIITSWRTLRFQSKLPTVPGASLQVDILDSLGTIATTKTFAEFPASQTPGNVFPIDPDRVPALRGRQAIRLRAILKTDNAFVTPQLLNWEVEWSSVRFGPSQIRFANRNLDPLSFMRLSNSNKDSAYIVLTDPNAQAILDTITVQVQSKRVGDSESFFLRIDPTNRAFFSTRSGIPLVFANEPTRNNKKLEVRDRDTLFVSYVDPRDSNDRSNATAVVVQRVKGTVQIENIALSAPDTLAIGDQAFVRVLGETDHNLSPTKRDTIFALLRDPQTNDQESITLLEIANVGAPAVFNTGNFRSVTGITLVKEGSVRNDGKLFTDAGNVIAASFEDEFDRIEDFATVIDSTGVDALQDRPFLLEIAPNPYRTQSGKPFKLRAQVRTGELFIRKVEIFNLAGDRVTTLGEGQILFKGKVSLSARLGRVEVNNWWSLKDNSFSAVASGTYFAKFDVLVNSEPRSQVIKFVVIQ